MGGSGGGGYFSDRRSSGGDGAATGVAGEAAGSSNVPGRPEGSNPGSGAGGGGAADQGDPCNIRTLATLRSPSARVVALISVGDDLEVRINAAPGIEVLEAFHSMHGRVGVIDCPEEQSIIECISQGHRYQARVRRIQGGAVTVDITRI
jgi:hypothetical protein